MIHMWVNVSSVGCYSALMLLKLHGIVAHLVVKTESATASTKHQYLALCAFGATLADISQTNNVEKITKMSLLKAKPLTMFYHDEIIQSINRTLQTQ